MSNNYRIDIIEHKWQGGNTGLLIEFKINSNFRRMVVAKEDMRIFFLTECKQYGINENNVDDMMNEKDAKYSLKEEFLKKYIQGFFKV